MPTTPKIQAGRPRQPDLFANRAYPNTGGWQDRHDSAVTIPRAGFELSLVAMLKAWQRYADAHRAAYGSPVGEDQLIGSAFAQIGEGLQSLRDGELGNLDSGTLCDYILGTLAANECEVEL